LHARTPSRPPAPAQLGAAHQGTLFFDEIGDCPFDVQAQLLRVMETGEYQRQGEVALRRVDVRFIGATNKDDSAFRPDFKARFRKGVRLPPLRERREDIGLLIRHLLVLRALKDEAFKERFFREGKGGRLEPRISGRLVNELVRHPLPTNVRQLDADSAHRDRQDRLMVIARIGHRDRPVGAKRRSSCWRVRGGRVRPPAFFGTVP